MSATSFSGSAEITDEGIKNHFQKCEPIQSILELVWNGLDANAKKVDVNTHRNELGGLESITVLDNGDGIDVENLQNNFKKFNESSKKNDDDKHGLHGRGRLAFHKLCERAIWYTRREKVDAKITIESSSIKDFKGIKLDDKKEQHIDLLSSKSGTCVELTHFGHDHKLPNDNAILDKLSGEFGWYLALNPSKNIFFDNTQVPVPRHEPYETILNVDGTIFNVKILRWIEKPSSEHSHDYLINGKHKVLEKKLSGFNKKPNFYTSTFISSEWVDRFDPDAIELITEFSPSSPTYKKLFQELRNYQKNIYFEFLRRYVDVKIAKFDEDGYFPSYKNIPLDYANWRKQNTKSIVREIYLADPSVFNTLNVKQTKILIRLLDKILVSNENDGLFEVLEGVLELDAEKIRQFADQLSKTTLENVISTIETLQKRQIAVHKLREIMETHFDEVLETPDLQKIIENNTWLFGERYATLGAEEVTFHGIAKRLRDEIKDVTVVNDCDIETSASISGINRQVDLFLARKTKEFDAQGQPQFKCVIIEIKRPGISLNKKHLQQIDEYAEIISKHAAFASERMKFEIILIGRKISKDDKQIKMRMTGLKDKGEYGLVSMDDRMKCYVKDWFTIFDEFTLANDYLLGTLNTKLEELSSSSTRTLVNELQTEKA